VPRLGEETRHRLIQLRRRGPVRRSVAFTALAALAAAGARAEWIVHDDAGRRLALERPAKRIVSLAPSATALLFAAGAGDRVLAVSEFSDEPEAARVLPRVGDSASADLERIVALRPDVVVVTERITPAVVISRLEGLRLPVYRTRATRLDDLAQSIRGLGRLAATDTAAEGAAARLESQVAALRRRYDGQPPVGVMYQVWGAPVYSIGGDHVITDALTLCGGRNVFADQRTAAPAVTREAVIARDPAVIVASGPDADARAWLDAWRSFPAIDAVTTGQLHVFSDVRLDRMGPSAVAAAESLCALVHRARR
jgi:iron complex transport system substrate-binding protein